MEAVVVTATNTLFSTSSPLQNNKKCATNLKFSSPSASCNYKKMSFQVSKSKGETEGENTISSSRSGSSTSGGGGGGKMDEYNTAMKKMMRNPYEYHHDLGMNYKLILDNLIVGSQPQKPEDIEHLRDEMNVAYILNLQQDRDVEFWGIDLQLIVDRCKEIGIRHMRRPATDFDGDSLRSGLPKAVSSLEWAVEEGKGRVYVHCTAGLGRAPAVAIAYMFWFCDMNLNTAYETLTKIESVPYVALEKKIRETYSLVTSIFNRNRNSVLEARVSQLVDSNAELQRKLHESQVAYQHLEQHVNAQKEAEESKKDDEEETAMAKKNGGKRKAEYRYNTRRASKAVAAMSSTQGESTNFEDESLTVQQRAEKEQAKLVLLPTGGTLEPYQIKGI
ncbi:hypothetical protein MKW98_020597 [Papaver atlanticum]|uniref:Uncharacterized protein n=1 Tax=Papaver atlanticum TaxID=357466 RepID=A0AAD4TI52_9MAGN|nr:hypothetical protein MKW98_020597 [Papaver atlanticum]